MLADPFSLLGAAQPLVEVVHGDALTQLRLLPAASVDAVITDPPYNLSDSGKRDGDCLRRILLDVLLPDDQQRDSGQPDSVDLAGPTVGAAPLSGVDGAVGEDARVGVPERAVDLERAPVVEQEVNAGDVPAARSTDEGLPPVADAEPVEHFGDYVFQLADTWDTTFCNGTCRCFTEPGPGLITVRVALPCTTGSDLAGDLLSGWQRSDTDVWLRDNPGSEAEAPTAVMTGPGAVVGAMLRLDLGRRTAELVATDATGDWGAVLQLVPAQSVGADARAGGLPAVPQTCRVSDIDDTANRAFALHIPWHKLKPTRRATGFMGKAWDGWESPASFQRWCTEWLRECLRVLKPGGHLAAFGGSRTYHRMACAVEDAGFEIRDSLQWIYGSGFPKSRRISVDIDRALDVKRDRVELVGGIGAGMGEGRYVGDQKHSPTAPLAGTVADNQPVTDAGRTWQGFGTALKPAVEPIVLARKPLQGTVAGNVLAHGVGGLNIDATRVGTDDSLNGSTRQHNIRSGRYGSDSESPANVSDGFAQHAQGRWPANVLLSHGEECADVCASGCPVAELDTQSGISTSRSGAGVKRHGRSAGIMGNVGALRDGRPEGHDDSGGASRFFPTFRYSSGDAQFSADPDRPSAAGLTPEPGTDGRLGVLGEPGTDGSFGKLRTNGHPVVADQLFEQPDICHSDSFPRFRYQAKASTRERPKVNGIAHPTVKPLALMRWLVRLLCPPGGMVFEPFAGSGTTIEACIDEGMSVIGIEREAEYLPHIQVRVDRARARQVPPSDAGDSLALFEVG